ncbi:hypothetical protein [Brevundimonas sp.]|uniref:hypothetical protein n=1 Tax=Brevundimonas sp. TaxID=1871086 RepID=UPI002FC60B83
MLMQIAADTPVSPESKLDREMEDLIGKIVDGSATEGEIAHYNELISERRRLMHPEAITRFEYLRTHRRR